MLSHGHGFKMGIGPFGLRLGELGLSMHQDHEDLRGPRAGETVSAFLRVEETFRSFLQ